MLLYIYLGSTAYVWFDTIKSMIKRDKRLKREGYKFIGPKFNGLPDVIVGVIYGIALSIPIFNIAFPLSNRDKEKSYEEYKNMLLEAGAIEEPDELINYSNIEKGNKKNNTINIDNARLVARENRYGHIYYSSIGNEENSDNLEKTYTYKKEFKKRRY